MALKIKIEYIERKKYGIMYKWIEIFDVRYQVSTVYEKMIKDRYKNKTKKSTKKENRRKIEKKNR